MIRCIFVANVRMSLLWGSRPCSQKSGLLKEKGWNLKTTALYYVHSTIISPECHIANNAVTFVLCTDQWKRLNIGLFTPFSSKCWKLNWIPVLFFVCFLNKKHYSSSSPRLTGIQAPSASSCSVKVTLPRWRIADRMRNISIWTPSFTPDEVANTASQYEMQQQRTEILGLNPSCDWLPHRLQCCS